MAGYMQIQTEDGQDIYCLPPVAWCKCAGKDIEDMDECPLRTWDDGDTCKPSLCDQYTEDAADVTNDKG